MSNTRLYTRTQHCRGSAGTIASYLPASAAGATGGVLVSTALCIGVEIAVLRVALAIWFANSGQTGPGVGAGLLAVILLIAVSAVTAHLTYCRSRCRGGRVIDAGSLCCSSGMLRAAHG